jgi:hypothetical protein
LVCHGQEDAFTGKARRYDVYVKQQTFLSFGAESAALLRASREQT